MPENLKSRRGLYTFILLSVLEEVIIGFIAFILLLIFLPVLLIPGMMVVGIGLVIFTLIKIYTYWTSSSIPVYDPMIGQEGTALSDFQQSNSDHWIGKVLVRGEHWNAQSQQAIKKNSQIWVYAITGLTLIVKPTPFSPFQETGKLN